MTLFAGIDGGQSSTTAVVGDETGRLLGRGSAGPADEVGQGTGSTRLHDALNGALDAARASAGLPLEAHFGAIVAGVSGYEGRVYGKPPDVPASRLVLLHDAPIAHAGALAGEPGVTVIAGTGSVVYATGGGRVWTKGGWGYVFGDEGSAFWFAREALGEMMLGEDYGVAHEGADAQGACAYFGVSSLRALARAFYSGELTRERIASFAPQTLHGEQGRLRLIRAASQLAMLVREAIVQGAPPRVALVGGMFSNEAFAAEMRAQTIRWRPGVEIVEPKYDPAAGALLLAYREAGVPVTELRS